MSVLRGDPGGSGKIFVAGDHPGAAVGRSVGWAAFGCALLNCYRTWLRCWWSRWMLLAPLWWSRLVPAPVLRQGVRAAVHRAKGTTVVCTSNYKGAEVEWDVAIGDKSAWSDNVVTFTANPRKGIIAKEGV